MNVLVLLYYISQIRGNNLIILSYIYSLLFALHASLFVDIHVTFPAHLIFLDFIILILGEHNS
jgi:hypothetical protein